MRDQHGVISFRQALAAGLTRGQIRQAVCSGRWLRVAHGVYRHAAVPSSPRSRLLTACIVHKGLASHASAAAMHGIDGFKLRRLEVSAGRGYRAAMPQVTLHQSTQMHLARPVVRDSIPCTGVARTVLDLAAVLSRKRLDRAIDAVLRDRRLRPSDLHYVLMSHASRGRNGCAALRSALAARFGDDPVPLSEWSRMVAELLVDAGHEYPALEHRIHDASGAFVAQVDLAYPSHRLAIELDSRRWHLNSESFVNDRRRRNQVVLAGWTMLNFTWDDYAQRRVELCAEVSAALAAYAQRN